RQGQHRVVARDPDRRGEGGEGHLRGPRVNASPERHLSADSFAAYLHGDEPTEHPLPGTPRLHLFIDPDRVRIGLRGPAGPREVPVATGLEHVTVRAVHHQQRRMIEIEISDARLFTDAYPVLCAVADRV